MEWNCGGPMWPDELYIAQDWWDKDLIALRKPSVRFIRASAPDSPTDTKEIPFCFYGMYIEPL